MYQHIKFKHYGHSVYYYKTTGACGIQIYRGTRLWGLPYRWNLISFNCIEFNGMIDIGSFKHLRHAKLYVRCNLDLIVANQAIKDII